MPKTKISEFSATAGNNTDIDGINIAEGCPPSGINDAIRELMAQLKDFQAGTAGDSFNGPVGTTTPAAGAFTNFSASGTFALTGDQVQISEGGTGQTTANAAFNALAPSQSTHAGKYLKTDGTNTSWDAIEINTADITGTLPVANGGTGVTSSTGTGSVVLSASPTFTGTVNGAALTLSSSLTLSGGTANGVAYLNGSKVLTTGSALTFDGTTFATTGRTSSANGAWVASGAVMGWGAAGTFTNYIVGDTASNYLLFQVNSAEGMRLTSTGLGIGTSSPAYRLDVRGSSSPTIRVRNTSAVVSNFSQLLLETANTFSGLGNAYLRAISMNAGNSSTALAFGVNADGGGAPYEAMRLDQSGNLGLGVTPSAWQSPFVAFQISTGGAALTGRTDGGQVNLSSNWRYGSGTNLYINNGFASRYAQESGGHYWYTAASGTAGNTITFSTAMTLDASGNLGLGVTPSAWVGYKALEFTNGKSIAGFGSGGPLLLTQNSYFNGSNWIYKGSAAASLYVLEANGSHVWQTAASGTAGNAISFTQAMTLDASGRLGIGTTSPGFALDVATADARIRVAPSTTTNLALFQATNGGGSAYIGLDSNAGGLTSQYALNIYHNGAYPITFSTNSTERARITSGGDLLVGTTSQPSGVGAARLGVVSGAADYLIGANNTHASDPYGIFLKYTAATPNGNGNRFFFFADATATRAYMQSNGGLANYSGNNTNLSDRREKTNFAPAKSYLDTICAIPVQTFNYIDQSEDDPGLTIGVVAQDVQAVAPELVMESNWGTAEDPKMRLSIYQTDLQYALMKCIQELKAQNDDLRARVAQLEAK